MRNAQCVMRNEYESNSKFQLRITNYEFLIAVLTPCGAFFFMCTFERAEKNLTQALSLMYNYETIFAKGMRISKMRNARGKEVL